jgi:hypothetical protein
MLKRALLGFAATTAVIAMLSTPADAAWRGRGGHNAGAAVAAGIVGLAAGAAIAGAARGPAYDPYYYGAPAGYYDPGYYGYADPGYAYGPGYDPRYGWGESRLQRERDRRDDLGY